jgi:hypothetical protein
MDVRVNRDTASRTPTPWGWIAALVAARMGLYLLSSGPMAYGYMGDEFYFLACAKRLAWGYVDQPPLGIWLLAGLEPVLGSSLPALHLLPTLAHAAAMVLGALLARELGGGRAAQGLAALATLVAPVYLGAASNYSLYIFDVAVWAGAAWVLARIANGASPRAWWLLGTLLGLGLLDKLSVLWLGAGIAVGLVATPGRRWLASPWPWLAAGLALAIASPYVVWLALHEWAAVEFLRNAAAGKLVHKTPLEYLGEQLLMMHPACVPLWVAGLASYFATATGRRHQLLGWVWITAFGILAASGAARSSYLAPAYTVLVPAGAVVFERLARRRAWRWLPATAAAVLAVAGLGAAPFATPLLPPERYVAFERWLGLSAPRDENLELGALPLHFAERFGWGDVRRAVREAAAGLSPAERGRAAVYSDWFQVAATVDFYREREGLPPALSGHNTYWLWGPGDASGEVLLAVVPREGSSPTKLGLPNRVEDLRRWYGRVEPAAEVDCTWCLPDLARLVVYVCREPRVPIGVWWAEVKRYI